MAIDFDVNRISAPMKSTLLAMHRSDVFKTVSEMSEGPNGRKPTGMALTLMSIRTDPWVERKWAVWGGETEQKHGAGYEYRLTPIGLEIVVALSAMHAR